MKKGQANTKQTDLFDFLPGGELAAPPQTVEELEDSLSNLLEQMQSLASGGLDMGQKRSYLDDTPAKKKQTKVEKNNRWATQDPADRPVTWSEYVAKHLDGTYHAYDDKWVNACLAFCKEAKARVIDVTSSVNGKLELDYKKIFQWVNYFCGRVRSDKPRPTKEDFEMAAERAKDYCFIHACYPCLKCVEKAMEV